MAFDSPAPISRRTVAKGIAWTAPAVAIAGTAPAFAVSAPPPALVFLGGCKFPGSKCDGTVKQSYGFRFQVTNSTNLDIYFCDAWLSNISTSDINANELVWKHDGCVKVPANGQGTINFFFEYTKSPNLNFSAILNVKWSHNCPCSEDPYPHVTIQESVEILETPPFGACTCDSDFV